LPACILRRTIAAASRGACAAPVIVRALFPAPIQAAGAPADVAAGTAHSLPWLIAQQHAPALALC